MIMGARTEAGTALMLPETLQAPHLRHLALYEHGELPRSCYPSRRSLRLQEVAMSVTHSPHSSMPARMQATL
jgi:hypothetical protein